MKSPYPSNTTEGTPPVLTPTENGTAVITDVSMPMISGIGRRNKRRSYRDLMRQSNAISSIGSLVLIDYFLQFNVLMISY
jgi:hypothetical protein